MNKIHKILIANRGEIACRVMKTCRNMGIFTVAVYSEIDRDALFVGMADEAVNIGESGIETYLDQDRIIEAAKRTGAEAIHPGYGLLSENAAFPARCRDEGIVFIGPSPESIATMGSKTEARALCEKIGVPVIPGFPVQDETPDELAEKASAIGFPVLIKASAGGGGIGIFVVEERPQFKDVLSAARKKSLAIYGTDALLVEKYLKSVRHVEFQIMADAHGSVIHCFERECSVQRRHQKLIEESPSPAVTEQIRKKMGEAAVSVARAVNYRNAGTIEFVLTDGGSFYFLEMNTRLQVEHTVTEAVTGLDLVALQIGIAEGRPLGLNQEDLEQTGHAVECRIYAEDPARGFNPSAGKVLLWKEPDSARTDSGIRSGSKVSIAFDPLLAKVVTHAGTREDAIQKMRRSLSETVALGVATNTDFLSRLLSHETFLSGKMKTDFFDKENEDITRGDVTPEQTHALVIAGIIARAGGHENFERKSPWKGTIRKNRSVSFRVYDTDYTADYQALDSGALTVKIGTCDYAVVLAERAPDSFVIEVNGLRQKFYCAAESDRVYLHSRGTGHQLINHLSRFHSMDFQQHKKGTTEAPMDGKIASIRAAVGESVVKGQELIVIESMKMENIIYADQIGRVKAILVALGDFVTMGTVLIEIDTEDNS